jgi:hypothetical protein
MRAKSLLALFIALVFTLSIAGAVFAAAKEVKGTVTKIDETKKELTIKTAAGKEATVKVKDVSGIKVGDSVVVKDGKATKEAAKPAPKPKPAAPGY